MTAMSTDDNSPFCRFSSSTCIGAASTVDSVPFSAVPISMDVGSFAVIDGAGSMLAVEAVGGEVDFTS